MSIERKPMKTMMICLVMMSVAVAQAETDAEKVVRLEKENIELRNQVQAQKQAIAVLQRKVEALTPKPASKIDVTASTAAAIKEGTLLEYETVSLLIPRELLINDPNAAKGLKYDPVEVNTWLEKNVVGRPVRSKPFEFSGQVEVIERIASGGALHPDDVGSYFIGSAGGSPGWFVIPPNQKESIAKLKEGQWVVMNGTIRKAWAQSEEEYGVKRFSRIHMVVEAVTLTPSKPPQKRR